MRKRARPFLPLVILGVLCAAAGCRRVSHLERFGGSTVAVHVDRVSPGSDLAAVRSALWESLSIRSIPVDMLPLDAEQGFVVQFPYGVDGVDAVKALIEDQERRAKAIELRLGYYTRTRAGLVAYAVAPGMGPGQSDSCRYARDGECDEGKYCAAGTDWTDCHSGRRVNVFVEPAAIADGSALSSAKVDAGSFQLAFDGPAQAALRDAKARNPSALLAVFLKGEFAGAPAIGGVVSDSYIAFAADNSPWQLELTTLASAPMPAQLRLGRHEETPPPDFDGRGSKYPW